MKYNLPRGYLSFSAMQLWKGSKMSYRNKYYSNEEYSMETPYTKFGKEIAEILEDPEATKAHPVLAKIPSYSVPEYGIEIDIEDIPIKGYLDGFCPKTYAILEYKTGIRKKTGAAPWDNVKVKKHDQLLLYSLLVKELHGEVDPIVKLVWMETHWAENCVDKKFGDSTFKSCHPGLALTGHFETFERKIEDWEHLHMRQSIIKIAEEITDDYTRYQSTAEGADSKGAHVKPTKKAVGGHVSNSERGADKKAKGDRKDRGKKKEGL
jgi:hypothetical protein